MINWAYGDHCSCFQAEYTCGNDNFNDLCCRHDHIKDLVIRKIERLAYEKLGDEYSVHIGIQAGVDAALEILNQIIDGEVDVLEGFLDD